MDTYDELRKYGDTLQRLSECIDLLRRRVIELERISAIACKKAPEGMLKIENRQEHRYYYQRTKVNGKYRNRYIPQGKEELIRALAAKQYIEKVMPKLKRNLNQMEKLMKFDPVEEDQIAASLNPALVSLCDAFYLPPQKYAELWQSDYNSVPLENWDPPDKQTLRGDFVRSKSEVFIADGLFRYGISYKHECSLILDNGITLHPDFQILHPRSHELFYWEHFGMMDDDDYRNEAMKKLNMYWRYGPIPGKRLICTFETRNSPMTSAQVDAVIRAFFL